MRVAGGLPFSSRVASEKLSFPIESIILEFYFIGYDNEFKEFLLLLHELHPLALCSSLVPSTLSVTAATVWIACAILSPIPSAYQQRSLGWRWQI
jgi:hypothetical protein